jgi:hypothetical protein
LQPTGSTEVAASKVPFSSDLGIGVWSQYVTAQTILAQSGINLFWIDGRQLTITRLHRLQASATGRPFRRPLLFLRPAEGTLLAVDSATGMIHVLNIDSGQLEKELPPRPEVPGQQ